MIRDTAPFLALVREYPSFYLYDESVLLSQARRLQRDL